MGLDELVQVLDGCSVVYTHIFALAADVGT